MKTYAQENQFAPFDWNTALERAIKEEPDDKTIQELEDNAESWVTCACGNQCSAIPRYSDGAPEDMKLGNLGITFMNEIRAGKWESAKLTLVKIEARSTEILKSLETK